MGKQLCVIRTNTEKKSNNSEDFTKARCNLLKHAFFLELEYEIDKRALKLSGFNSRGDEFSTAIREYGST
jgi:hypothetical protein